MGLQCRGEASNCCRSNQTLGHGQHNERLSKCEELTTNEEFLRQGRCNLGAEDENMQRIRQE